MRGSVSSRVGEGSALLVSCLTIQQLGCSLEVIGAGSGEATDLDKNSWHLLTLAKPRHCLLQQGPVFLYHGMFNLFYEKIENFWILGKENLSNWQVTWSKGCFISMLWYLHFINICQIFLHVLFMFLSCRVLLPTEVIQDLQGLCT